MKCDMMASVLLKLQWCICLTWLMQWMMSSSHFVLICQLCCVMHWMTSFANFIRVLVLCRAWWWVKWCSDLNYDDKWGDPISHNGVLVLCRNYDHWWQMGWLNFPYWCTSPVQELWRHRRWPNIPHWCISPVWELWWHRWPNIPHWCIRHGE